MTAALGGANAVVVVARTAYAHVDDIAEIKRAGADIHRLAATDLAACYLTDQTWRVRRSDYVLASSLVAIFICCLSTGYFVVSLISYFGCSACFSRLSVVRLFVETGLANMAKLRSEIFVI